MNCVFHVLRQVGAKRKSIQTTHVYLRQCTKAVSLWMEKGALTKTRNAPKRMMSQWRGHHYHPKKTSLTLLPNAHKLKTQLPINHQWRWRELGIVIHFAGFSSPTVFGSRVEVGFGTCGSFGLWASRPFVGAMTTAPLVALHTDYSILVCVLRCGVTLLL